MQGKTHAVIGGLVGAAIAVQNNASIEHSLPTS